MRNLMPGRSCPWSCGLQVVVHGPRNLPRRLHPGAKPPKPRLGPRLHETIPLRCGSSTLMFINADPDGKGLDVWSSGSRTFSNVAYKTITPHMQLPAHVDQFRLREAGGTEDLAANRREMFPGRHYTVVALPKQNHSSRLAVIRDNLAELEPGSARVRLINATPVNLRLSPLSISIFFNGLDGSA